MESPNGVLKRLVGHSIDRLAVRVARRIDNGESLWARSIDRQHQIALCAQWRKGAVRCQFTDVEFSSYSQNGEDGILLYIFCRIGTLNKTVVEVCAGDGMECNAANLVINHGWRGLLFDGDAALIDRGKRFYSQRTNSWRLHRLGPILVQAWITAETINDLIAANGVSGEIDLLSIDMDGNDFWIWKAISCISPRVVVAEYNNRFPIDRCLTVPYDPNFALADPSPESDGYFGASLSALHLLGRSKGYRLIGANGPNTNAFFMRDDVGVNDFLAVNVAECLSSDYAKHQHATHWPKIKGLPFVGVTEAVCSGPAATP
jgi:hypothetical protein